MDTFREKKMSIDKLKRIMWRLRERERPAIHYILKELKTAILYEVGGDKRTIKKYTKLLIEQGLLKRLNRYHFKDIGGVL